MKKILPSAILLIQAALGAQIRNDAVAERLSNAGAVQRGRVLQVQSGDVNAKPVKWRQTSIRPYARADSDRPFALDGTFSDDELVGLLAYIRTSPAPRVADE